MALSELAQSLWRGGYRTWNRGTQEPVLVTYSFATSSKGFYENEDSPLLPFTEAQQASIRLAVNAWGSVSGLKFIEVPDAADYNSVGLRFRMADITGSYSVNSPSDTGDVTIDSQYIGSGMQPGSEAYEILLMSVGYAIGLNVVAASQTADTAMARYAASNPNVAALRPADIEAIQYTYGTQDTEDRFHIKWSWDAAFNGIRYDGDDTKQTIYGAVNRDLVVARGGDDSIATRGGDDLIYAGDGNDEIDAGDGNDLIYAGTGTNQINGHDGVDTLATLAFRHQVVLQEGVFQHGLRPISFTAPNEINTFFGIEILSFGDGRLDDNDPAAQVVRLYQAALGREPDAPGREFWTSQLMEGAPLSRLANGFLDSPEFLARFGQPDDAGFVATAYRQALGREPDAGGQAYWQSKLASGFSRADLLTGFSESPENRGLTSPLVAKGIWDADDQVADIARLYKAVLGRTPELDGLRYWDAQADHGATEAQMANLFASSPEFNSRFPGASDVDFVNLVYLNTLGRAPEQEGQTFWLNHLSQGLTRGEMVAGVSHSSEFLTLTTSLTEGGVVFA